MDENALIQEMMKKGHSQQSAQATIAGRKQSGDLQNLWNEYMGGSSTGSGTTNGQSPEDYANAVLASTQKLIDEEKGWLEQYTKDNPFIFDEEAAKQASAAEYLPYYSELLQDYLQDIGYKRSTVQGERALLKDLYTLDTGRRTRAFGEAKQGAEEGFAGKGMFFSGIRMRDVGQKTSEYNADTREAGARYTTGEAELGRQEQQLGIDETRRRRDLFGGDVALGGVEGFGPREGTYHSALASGIQTRKQRAIQGYNIPLEQAYNRRFGNSANPLAGYTISDYLQYA